MTRALLTGFDPFGEWASNPSWDALVRADQLGLFGDLQVELVRAPVTWDGAFEALESAVANTAPDFAISFGLHGGMKGRGADVIYVETTARNRDGAPKPDNAGIQRAALPIDADGPDTLPTGLPTARIVKALLADGFSAEPSGDAGAYLCNHLFYRGALSFGGRFPYGFVHVPPVESLGGSLTLDRLAAAVALIARYTAEQASS
jgi:pyroglutamyl-peptidase